MLIASHIQRSVLATEETTVTQQVSHRPIKYQSRLWSQRGTKVNGSHRGDNPLLRTTWIQIATKKLCDSSLQAMVPTNIKTVHRTPYNSRLCELRIDYLIEDGRGPQWRPESAETFIFRNTLWPSGRFLRGIFSKNYLGWRGTKISLKISSGAQSENLEPSLTIQEFFSKKYSCFLCSVCVPFLSS